MRGRAWLVVRGRARSCAVVPAWSGAWSCVVVRGRAWLCVVVHCRAWSCVVGRARSCVVVRGRAWSCVVVRSCRSARFAASTAVARTNERTASTAVARTNERTNERTTSNNPLNPPGVGGSIFFESIYPHMRAKFGLVPTAVSKIVSFKFISRTWKFAISTLTAIINMNVYKTFSLSPTMTRRPNFSRAVRYYRDFEYYQNNNNNNNNNRDRGLVF